MKVENELKPLTSYIPENKEQWEFLQSFITKEKDFLVHNDLQTVRTHINNLDITYYPILCSYCLPEKAIFNCTDEEREVFIQKDEPEERHFERLKQIYIQDYGVLYEVDYLNRYIKLNFEVLHKKLIKQNLGYIPANTEQIFHLKDAFSLSEVSFYGTNPERIELSQIFVESQQIPNEKVDEKKSSSKWELLEDFTGLKGPGVDIINRSTESIKMLEAIIKLNAKCNGALIKQIDFFDFANSDAYERKMSKFTKNYPCYKKILRYDNRRKAYKVLIPPDWCTQFL